MISITTTYKYFQVRLPLYCIGDREAIKQALRNIFTKGGFALHSERDDTLIHYPSGLMDRMLTGYIRMSNMQGGGPFSDTVTASWHITNNPIVTLIAIDFYFKKNKSRADAKFQALLESVVAAMQAQFSVFDIPIVDNDGWRSLIAAHPNLSCSPVWDAAASNGSGRFAELSKSP
jgi:hypothetical protein